ncbi:MAG: ABC transporter permease [Bryobacterales bacterium]|nr:ABC transporter permease [Bryobacterales bacterium]
MNTSTVDALQRDTRHALRRLARDWPFSIGAIVIIAFGIAANTAVFSILNNTLFQPQPFAGIHRLVNVYQNNAISGEPDGVSYPAFLDLQNETAVFTHVAASQLGEGRFQTALAAPGTAAPVQFGLIEYASANYLDTVGLRPAVGRWFTDDEQRRADPVAVLGWSTWQRHFRADPGIIGETLNVNGIGVEIIGIAPATLNSSPSPSLIAAAWLPVTLLSKSTLAHREALPLQVRARLRDGVTLTQAQAAMSIAAQRLAAEHRDTDPKRGITVLATAAVQVHPREKALKPVAILCLTIVALVLAVACSNLATLLLVRGSARKAEISLRLALGASRRNLVQLLLLESLVLSAVGAAAGVALAHAGLRYLATINLPVVLNMQMDGRMLAFAVVAAICCGVGFGLPPALQATRVDLAVALREEKGSSSGALSLARSWFTWKNALVTAQVTTSFLLLAGAVLALGILNATQQRAVGYRPDGIAVLQLDTAYAGLDATGASTLLTQLQRSVAASPGVESVFVTSGIPIDNQFDQQFRLERAVIGAPLESEGRWAGPGYFHTLGIPVLHGRVFDERDQPQAAPAVVVSEAFARRYFGSPDTVGRSFWLAGDPPIRVQIIGVVGDVRSVDMVVDQAQSTIYRSAAQGGGPLTTLVARTSHRDSDLLALMQQQVRRQRPDLPVLNAITMRQRQGMELMPFRIAFVALGILGVLGVLLSSVGLYAVVAYAVAQRTAELGIRMALGARPRHLSWLVVRDVTALVLVGIGGGTLLAWAAVILLNAFVAPIMGLSGIALLPVAAVILLCGAAAAYIPTRRAIRIDPIAAIRYR